MSNDQSGNKTYNTWKLLNIISCQGDSSQTTMKHHCSSLRKGKVNNNIRSSAYVLWLLAWCFVRLLIVEAGMSMTLLTCYWDFFPSVLVHPWGGFLDGFSSCLVIFCFVIFGYFLSEAFSFLKINWGSMDLR